MSVFVRTITGHGYTLDAVQPHITQALPLSDDALFVKLATLRSANGGCFPPVALVALGGTAAVNLRYVEAIEVVG